MNSLNLEAIQTEKAPEAIGPYSQAIKVGDFVFTSGQIPLEPKTGEVVSMDIEEQTKQVLENIKNILESSGSDLDHVVKATIYLQDMGEFGRVNELYGSYFKNTFPARSCVEVSRLPKGVLIEIEVIGIMK